jgi:2-polyprenyl-3-methyl-5-hydroxy-6-metoxy-1,4-benzoquinol methylase
MGSDWHTEQDRQIDRSFDQRETVANSVYAAKRIWLYAAQTFLHDVHLRNLVLIKKKEELFRVLDLGCGDGALACDIASFFKNAEVVGIDANAKSLEIVRNKPSPPNLSFIQANVMQIDLAELEKLGKFDVVICSEVFEHVEDTDKLLDVIEYCLNDRGFLSFSTPSGWMYRLPRLQMIHWMLKNPRRYYNVVLNPEKQWRRALKHHPGTQPSKFIKRMEKRGFEVVNRASSLIYLNEDPTSILHTMAKWIERISPVKGPTYLFYAYMLCESLMNLVPLFRIFEARFIILLQRC